MVAELQPIDADTRPAFEARAFSVERINIERRQSEDEPDTLKLSGHAAVFNQPADIAGIFREQIKRGAFSRAIEERQDVALLLNHDPSTVMARVSNSTLRLAEDAIGLYFEAELDPRDPDSQRTVNKIERGNISQMSFAFQAHREEWDYDTEPPLRTIIDTDLFDVSPVTYPAYQQTDVHAREIARRNGVSIPAATDALASDPPQAEGLAPQRPWKRLRAENDLLIRNQRKGVCRGRHSQTAG